jgi:hypothetical protein
MTKYQWIIDKAETVTVERKDIVAQTISRSGVVNTVSRGGQIWRFEVRLPDGLPWSEIRPLISIAEYEGQTQGSYIQFNAAGHDWIMKYQGNSVNTTGFIATWTQGQNAIILTSSPSTPVGGFKFRAGDVIQLGQSSTGNTYTVREDVPHNSNSVYLNRPITDSSATGRTLTVGPEVRWNVKCTQFPTWTLMSRNQVSWSGPFIFYEAV